MQKHPIIVIKLGTSTLTNGTLHLSRPVMLDLIRQVAQLHRQNYRIVIVSSGAMAAGREILNNPDLPQHLPAKQMLCAVGQGYLMQVYSTLFGHYDLRIGQILLTHDDLHNRTRYLNARNTISTLLDYGVVPIINENDTLAVEEIKVGDNDNLSALIAALLDADHLILLTDQEGLFDDDPRQNPAAQLIRHVENIDDYIWSLATNGRSNLGTGGMQTKIQAAQLAIRSGTQTTIARGTTPDIILRIVMKKEGIGTHFQAKISHLESRKRWLLTEKTEAKLQIDKGAEKVLKNEGASLLPIGIHNIQGTFQRGDVVAILNENKITIAHGQVNYSSIELKKIIRQHSREINQILGYTYGEEAIHRDNMIILDTNEGKSNVNKLK